VRAFITLASFQRCPSALYLPFSNCLSQVGESS
jgi:hypothetical protein